MSLKDLAAKAGLWENDGEAPPAAPLAPPAQEIVARPVLPADSAANPIYDTLVAHTSFEGTDVGKVYAKYYAKLTRITDDHQRRATAMDLASNEGVDTGKLSATFDQLDGQLQAETDRFNAACDARMKSDFEEPKRRADDIATQVDRLKQEEVALRSALQPALDAISRKKAQFQAAWERRSAELRQQRSLFTEGR